MTDVDRDQVLAALERCEYVTAYGLSGWVDLAKVKRTLAALPAILLDPERIIEALETAQESAFADLRLAVASDQHKGEYNFLNNNYLGGISKGLDNAIEIVRGALPVLETKKEAE